MTELQLIKRVMAEGCVVGSDTVRSASVHQRAVPASLSTDTAQKHFREVPFLMEAFKHLFQLSHILISSDVN